MSTPADLKLMLYLVERFYAQSCRSKWFLDESLLRELRGALFSALNEISAPLEAYEDKTDTGFRNACNMLGVEVHQIGDTKRQWDWPYTEVPLEKHSGVVCYVVTAKAWGLE